MSRMIRVVLVDDHQVVRIGFRMLLDGSEDIRVIAEAGSADAACREVELHHPDVVLMDIGLGGTSGIEATRRIVARDSTVRVLALSSHEDPSHVRLMLKAGALGFVSKRSGPEELMEAIRCVASGKRYLDNHISRRLAMQAVDGGENPTAILSEREFAVFIELANGLSVNQIAEQMCISPRTAGTHLYNIKQKLSVGNQAELTLLAVRHGLIEP